MKLLILLFLVSCGAVISNEGLEKAQKMCAANGGLVRIWAYHFENDVATCANGARFTVSQ